MLELFNKGFEVVIVFRIYEVILSIFDINGKRIVFRKELEIIGKKVVIL